MTSTNPKYSPAAAAAITQHLPSDPAGFQRVSNRPDPKQQPMLVDPDPSWPAVFRALESRIRAALGDKALAVRHVGSTSVPGLPAKPCIDVDVEVADPADEGAYVAALVGEGWEDQKVSGDGGDGSGSGLGTGMGPESGDRGAGLQFLLREPGWYEHRVFICHDPVANVHVFGPGCPEAVRHRLFRDWLSEVSE